MRPGAQRHGGPSCAARVGVSKRVESPVPPPSHDRTPRSVRILGIDPGSQITGLRHRRLRRRAHDGRRVGQHPQRRRAQRPPPQHLRRARPCGARVQARRNRDRARVPASQCRQRAEARPGARRGDLRDVRGRRADLRVQREPHQESGGRPRRRRERSSAADGADDPRRSSERCSPMRPMRLRRRFCHAHERNIASCCEKRP